MYYRNYFVYRQVVTDYSVYVLQASNTFIDTRIKKYNTVTKIQQ